MYVLTYGEKNVGKGIAELIDTVKTTSSSSSKFCNDVFPCISRKCKTYGSGRGS